MKRLLRLLPAVHMLQSHTRFKELLNQGHLSAEGLTILLQEQLAYIRNQMLEGKWKEEDDTEEAILHTLFNLLEKQLTFSNHYNVKPVINATGIVLHTNLGRARLSERAIEQITRVARHYSNLEYNVEEGNRGSRHALVEELICDVTKAEAAMVVNNNAAAVYLILRALANDKSVLVSRGELVEIGGSFRVSSIMEESGALLKEIGTTNKTHLKDYRDAMDESTAMIMKVHTSNFKILGFTDEVPMPELVNLASQYAGVITYEDLGSGALYPFTEKGIGEEPQVKQVMETGVDLVSFSGDKLLGGPQVGIIAGKASLITQLKKHQLARVLRVDKLTLAALEGTLVAYKYGQLTEIPTMRDILKSSQAIKTQAMQFVDAANDIKLCAFDIKEGTSRIGGGTMPEVELPTFVVSVQHKTRTSSELATFLRRAEIPIIGRIKEDMLLLDFRTVTDDEQKEILHVLEQLK